MPAADVLTHQAGVRGLPSDLTTEQLCDWNHMVALVGALREHAGEG